jgi:hypothetical protein
MNSEMEKFKNQQGSQNQQQQRRTGDIFISKKPQSKEVKSDKVGGDYVDFEEIKD